MGKNEMKQWIEYDDSLKHYRKMLNEVAEESKTVNTQYQKYLHDNPYKERKNQLDKQKARLVKIILDLAAVKYQGFSDKVMQKIIKKYEGGNDE